MFLGVAYIAGMRMRWLVIGAIALTLLSPVIWRYGLHDYQKSRIETFLDPSKDPKGAGYQQIQAEVTVGSGGLVGKGFRQGTQGAYQFLPVAHNDFVFSVLAEEQGFVGVLVALGLYLFVIVRSLDAAKLARDRDGGAPRRRDHFGVFVPGVVQHHYVGGLGPGQGPDPAAHELWRVVARRDARRVRPHPQRADAAVYELTLYGDDRGRRDRDRLGLSPCCCRLWCARTRCGGIRRTSDEPARGVPPELRA